MKRHALSSVMMIAATLTAVLALAVFATSERAAACSCGLLTDDEALDYADAVFIGTLAEIITPGGTSYSSADPERFVFEVDEVFTGEVFARQSVVTARDGSSCGLEISGPGPFLVFAVTNDGFTSGAVEGELYSNLCSGTRELGDSAVPAQWGDASPPIAGASPIGSSTSGFPPLWILAAVGLTAAAVAAVLIARRVSVAQREPPHEGSR
jgi:hypothetical protein